MKKTATIAESGRLSDSDRVLLLNIEKQVQRMVAFIEMEGEEKSRSIDEKAEEEYNLTKGNLLYNGRRELQEIFTKRHKAAEKNVTQLESIIFSKAKMAVQTARQNFISEITTETQNHLGERIKSPEYPGFLKKILLQALCILNEPHVIVQGREEDRSRIQSSLNDIVKMYKRISGSDCKAILSKKSLPDWSMGGIVVYNRRCTLKVDNTLYDRLRIVLEHSLPIFRDVLFNEPCKRADSSIHLNKTHSIHGRRLSIIH